LIDVRYIILYYMTVRRIVKPVPVFFLSGAVLMYPEGPQSIHKYGSLSLYAQTGFLGALPYF